MNGTIKTLAVLLVALFFPVSAGGADIHVPADHSTIQAAINAAVNGDTIYVAPGTYFENLSIVSKSIELIGDHKNTTFIDGSYYGSVIRLSQAPNVTISGFTIQHSENLWPESGILQIQSDHATISGNTFLLTPRAIYMVGSHDSLISDNFIYISRDNSLRLNDSRNNTIEYNIITAGGPPYTCNIELLNLSSGNTISKNRIEKHYCGIDIAADSPSNTISDNIISRCDYMGLKIESDDNLVTGNTVLQCTYGIRVTDASNTVISGNTIESSGGTGLKLINTGPTQIIDNQISRNSIGIEHGGGVGVISTIAGNTVIKNSYIGISIYNITRCSISDNTIANNGGAPGFDTCGLCLHSSSSENIIYHNSFSNNVVPAIDESGANSWDDGYPNGGNYWNDYTGDDQNGDGIGDTPFQISGYGAAVDGYPLMIPKVGMLWYGPYTIPADTGDTIDLYLEAGKQNAHRAYLILGSLTGSDPGIPLPGGAATLPLTWDSFTNMVLANLNSPMFDDFLGVLNASGEEKAEFRFNKPIAAKFIGRTIHFAYCLADPGPFDYVSQVMRVTIVKD